MARGTQERGRKGGRGRVAAWRLSRYKTGETAAAFAAGTEAHLRNLPRRDLVRRFPRLRNGN
jgi:hypothetical protein